MEFPCSRDTSEAYEIAAATWVYTRRKEVDSVPRPVLSRLAPDISLTFLHGVVRIADSATIPEEGEAADNLLLRQEEMCWLVSRPKVSFTTFKTRS